jgi:hypothetical protein
VGFSAAFRKSANAPRTRAKRKPVAHKGIE